MPRPAQGMPARHGGTALIGVVDQYRVWDMYGVWGMGYGVWGMEHGAWSMEHGIRQGPSGPAFRTRAAGALGTTGHSSGSIRFSRSGSRTGTRFNRSISIL